MKKVALFGCLLSSAAMAATSVPVQPDARYAHYLSPAGPLSVEALHKLAPQQQSQPSKPAATKSGAPKPARMTAATAATTGTYTYTYLRCWYRTNSSNLKPTTTYAWALDPSSGDYYRLTGYWWSSSVFDWKNMFYSNTSQATLNSVCQSTLAKQGIYQAPALVAAADNSLSFNYTVWSLDSGAQGVGINRMVVFGDSLSDNQNMYNASMWKLPTANTWFLGRFSNGNNWAEYTAANLNLPMYDWAVGGAAADVHSVLPGVNIPGLSDQVGSWQQYMQMSPGYQPANTLFTVLIGGNDLVNYSKTPDQIIASESQALQALLNSGARNILLLNLPDVSRAPVFQIKGGAATVAAQVQDFNSKLTALASSLKTQYGANIQVFDSYSLFNDLLNNPANYGVSNTTQSCLNINTDSTTNYMNTQTPRSNCTNADTFVFWDTLHPTTHTHKLLADRVSQFVHTAFGI